METNDEKIGKLTSRVAYLEFQRSNDLLAQRNTDRRLNRIERSLRAPNLLLPAKEDEKLEVPKQQKLSQAEIDALDDLFPDTTVPGGRHA